MTRRGDSGQGGQHRPLRKWGSRSGGGPVRPSRTDRDDRTERVERDERTERVEHTRRLDPQQPPPRGRHDERYGAPPRPGPRSGQERYDPDYYPEDGYPDGGYRRPEDRYGQPRRARYPDERYPGERYRDEEYPQGRRPPGRSYPDEPYHPDERRYPDGRYPDDQYSDERRYPDGRYPDDRNSDDRYRNDRQPRSGGRRPGAAGPPPVVPPGAVPPGAVPPGGVPPGAVPPGGVPRKLTVTRVAAARTSYLSRQLLRKVGAASRAQGASEAGLTPLIWLNAVNMAADAMIAVCLAGTIFFSAATSQQRANVALYLLITMAPFALVAPVIGPLLDRLHHGRRWALAGTLLGRALLAYIMASNFHNFGLYPAAFGTLVLAKAYGVLRAAAVPRVMPHQMTLVSANARLSLFGLGAAALAGVLAGGLIKISGSYPLALMLTAAVFVAGAVLAFRLPRHVDSPERGHAPQPVTSGRRGRFALDSQVVLALRATAAVRGLSGFLTLFMVFLIQSRLHGATAAFELGAIVAAAGAGSMIGTTAGARLRLARPDIVVLAAIGASAGTCVLAAVTYGIQSAVLLALVVGAANSLAKLSLDAIIQREVPEYLTASAFARSETMLQLAWVFGGGLGIVLPSRGTVGFSVAAALLVGAFAYIVISRRNLAPGPAPRAGRLGADGQPAG